MKAFPRRREGEPGGGKAQEGTGLVRRLNTAVSTTASHTEGKPWGRGGGTWRWWATASSGPSSTDERARTTDEVGRLCERSKPLKGEPWTWLWGEINPRGQWRSKPSRA